MAAHLIAETDIIDVSSLSMLIYGAPGVGKTYLAQTAADPITLDIDKGAHRAANRKAVMRFDKFADLADASVEIAKRKTIIVDTIGRLLDLLSADIIEKNAKHGSAVGGLTLQGFGALKARFAQWVNQLRLQGKDLVFICHEKEEKDGDDRIMRPDIQGGSYTEVMKFTDLVGYLYVDRQGRRSLDFNPSDRHLGKNAAQWQSMPVVQGTADMLGNLFADAKRIIGHTAEASASIARAVDDWTARLDADPTLIELNDMLPELSKLGTSAKSQVWAIILERATKYELTFDKASKKFVAPEGAVV